MSGINRARKKLAACTDKTSSRALMLELRIQRLTLDAELKKLDMPAGVRRGLVKFMARQHEVAVAARKLQELDTYTQGQLGATLGLPAEGPCKEVEDPRERRAALQQALPDRPPHAELCHRCDNPKCVASEHLFWGTSQDNMRDCQLKGRGRRKHGQSVLDFLVAQRLRLEDRLATAQRKLQEATCPASS